MMLTTAEQAAEIREREADTEQQFHEIVKRHGWYDAIRLFADYLHAMALQEFTDGGDVDRAARMKTLANAITSANCEASVY
jgi:geranylgeranyl pyrophosphate synthase